MRWSFLPRPLFSTHEQGRWLYPACLVLLCVLFFARPLSQGHLSAPLDIIVANYPWNQQPQYAEIAHAGVQNGLMSDAVDQLIPWYLFLRQELYHGRLPFWYPFTLGGEPFFAKDLPAVFYPITLLSCLLPLFIALQFLLMVKPLIAGLGMYAYLQAIGLRRPAAFVGAIAFMFSSYFFIWLNHPQPTVAGWLPWTLLAVEALLQARGRTAWWIAALAGVTGMQLLGGHIETSAHILLVTGLYATARAAGSAWRGGQPHLLAREALLRIGLCAGGLALGIALAAVQLLPTAFYVLSSYEASYRSNLPPVHIPLTDLSSWIIPNLSGNPAYGSFQLWPDSFNYAERVGYCGVTTCVLAGLALCAWRDRHARYVWPLVLLLVFALGMVYGVQPIFSLSRLPILRQLANHRLVFVMAFSISALAAIGADRLLDTADEASRARLRLPSVPVSLLGLASVAATGMFFCLSVFMGKTAILRGIRILGSLSGPVQLSVWAQAWTLFAAGLVAVCILLILALRRERISQRAAVLGLTLLVAGDVFAVGSTYNSSVNTKYLYPPDRLFDAVHSFGADGWLVIPEEPLPGGFLPPYGIRQLSAQPENIFLTRLEQFMADVNRFGPNPDSNVVVVTNLAPDRRLLALADVSMALFRTEEFEPPSARGRLVAQQEGQGDSPVFVLAPGEVVEQVFPATAPQLSALAFFIAVDGPGPSEPLTLRLSDDLTGTTLARSAVPVNGSSAGNWQIAALPTIAVQRGQRLRLTLSRSPDDGRGGQLRLFGTGRPLLEGATLLRSGQPTAAALRMRMYAPQDADGLTAVWRDGITTLYRVDGARPRAYIADGILTAKGGDQARSALDQLHVPGSDAVVETDAALTSQGGQAMIVRDRPGDIVVKVAAENPGVLVLDEGYGDGGWEVTVDGKAAKVLRANFLYQGVPVGEGEHIVQFRYRPPTFSTGVAISLFAGAALVLLLAWPLRPYVTRHWPGKRLH